MSKLVKRSGSNFQLVEKDILLILIVIFFGETINLEVLN